MRKLALATRSLALVGIMMGGATHAAAPSSGIPNTFASAISIDKVNRIAVIPIFKGRVRGRGEVWFILTEYSDFNDAVARGINWSPKLIHALGTEAVEKVSFVDDNGREDVREDAHRNSHKRFNNVSAQTIQCYVEA